MDHESQASTVHDAMTHDLGVSQLGLRPRGATGATRSSSSASMGVRPRGLVAALGCLVLALAACGAGESGDPPSCGSAAACPAGSDPVLGAEAQSACAGKASGSYLSDGGVASGKVSGQCQSNGECTLLCRFAQPCLYGIDTLSKDVIKCNPAPKCDPTTYESKCAGNSVTLCKDGTVSTSECGAGKTCDPATLKCVAADTFCGDGVRTGAESCDGKDLGGKSLCSDVDPTYDGGTLSCSDDCKWNYQRCCKDACSVKGSKQCSGGVEKTCDVDPSTGCLGWVGATQCVCDAGGVACKVSDTCGNGKRESSEACDKSDLNGKTCTTVDPKFAGGALSCSASCYYDLSGCCQNDLGCSAVGGHCDASSLITCTKNAAGCLVATPSVCANGCDVDHCVGDPCAGVSCNGHGSCVGGGCQCTGGWSGSNCGTPPAPCAGVNCNGHGSCVGGGCQCTGGWSGSNCSTPPDPCAGVNCNGHGSCAGGGCQCTGGWSGSNCSTPPDPCAGVNCNGHGSCVGGGCQCTGGWSGWNCNTPPDPCAGVNCNGHGSCAGGVCQCTGGWSGTYCTVAPVVCSGQVASSLPTGGSANTNCTCPGSGTSWCHALYRAAFASVSTGGSGPRATVSFQKFDGSSISAGRQYWVGVVDSSATLTCNQLFAYSVRASGTFGSTVSSQSVSFDIWASQSDFDLAPVGSQKCFALITDGAGVEGTRTWFQPQQVCFQKTCQ